MAANHVAVNGRRSHQQSRGFVNGLPKLPFRTCPRLVIRTHRRHWHGLTEHRSGPRHQRGDPTTALLRVAQRPPQRRSRARRAIHPDNDPRFALAHDSPEIQPNSQGRVYPPDPEIAHRPAIVHAAVIDQRPYAAGNRDANAGW